MRFHRLGADFFVLTLALLPFASDLRAGLAAPTRALEGDVAKVAAAADSRAAKTSAELVRLVSANEDGSTTGWSLDAAADHWSLVPDEPGEARPVLCFRDQGICNVADASEFDLPYLLHSRLNGLSPAFCLFLANARPGECLRSLADARIRVVGNETIRGIACVHLETEGAWPYPTLNLFFDPAKSVFVKSIIWWGDHEFTSEVTTFAADGSPASVSCVVTNVLRPSSTQSCGISVASASTSDGSQTRQVQAALAKVPVLWHPYPVLHPRQQVTLSESRPDDLTDRLAVAEAALHEGDWSTAVSQLAEIKARSPNATAFQKAIMGICKSNLPSSGDGGAYSGAGRAQQLQFLAWLVETTGPIDADLAPLASVIGGLLDSTDVSAQTSIAKLMPLVLDRWASSNDKHSAIALKAFAGLRPVYAATVQDELKKWAAMPISGDFGMSPVAGQIAAAIEMHDDAWLKSLLEHAVVAQGASGDAAATLHLLRLLIDAQSSLAVGDGRIGVNDLVAIYYRIYRHSNGIAEGNGEAPELLCIRLLKDYGLDDMSARIATDALPAGVPRPARLAWHAVLDHAVAGSAPPTFNAWTGNFSGGADMLSRATKASAVEHLSVDALLDRGAWLTIGPRGRDFTAGLELLNLAFERSASSDQQLDCLFALARAYEAAELDEHGTQLIAQLLPRAMGEKPPLGADHDIMLWLHAKAYERGCQRQHDGVLQKDRVVDGELANLASELRRAEAEGRGDRAASIAAAMAAIRPSSK